jgi:S-adenosylmethionine:tRNA ribosyltransferase-isomerase
LEEIKKRQIQTESLILHVWIGTFRPIDQNENLETHQLHHEYWEISLDLLEKIARHKIKGKTIIAVWTTSCRSLESLPYLRKSLLQDIKKKYSDEIQARRENLVKNLDSQPPRWKVEILKTFENSIFFSSSLFILPWYNFNIVDELITNFHLPKSTLLVLVSAFAGREHMLNAYDHAIKNNYRFYSFGDAMLIIWCYPSLFLAHP